MTKSYNSGPIMTDEQPSRTNSMYLRTEESNPIVNCKQEQYKIMFKASVKQKNNTANVVHYALNALVL